MTNYKSELIASMRLGTKERRKEAWMELKNFKLTKGEVIKIIKYCYYVSERDNNLLFEILMTLNKNLTKSDLIMAYEISEPLFKLFQEKKQFANI